MTYAGILSCAGELFMFKKAKRRDLAVVSVCWLPQGVVSFSHDCPIGRRSSQTPVRLISRSSLIAVILLLGLVAIWGSIRIELRLRPQLRWSTVLGLLAVHQYRLHIQSDGVA